MPSIILWQWEGGHRDPFALSAAISHASKCVQMGGPRINMNTMTNRVEFIHLKRIVKEQFSQCWSMYEKAVLGDSTEAHGSQVGMASEPPEKKDDDEPKNDNEAKVDERKNNSEKQRRVKSSLDVAVAEAIVVKSTMSTVTSSAKSVHWSMDVDPEWQREKC